MKRTITLSLKPLSINAMYCKNRSWKTAEYNTWSAAFFHKLDVEENVQIMEDLREFFNPKKHGYSIDLKFYYPKDTLFTKKGTLSSRAHDLSNVEKPLIDLLFLPVYFDKCSPYGCKNLNIDDKFIYELSSKKLPAKEYKIEINISIIST